MPITAQRHEIRRTQDENIEFSGSQSLLPSRMLIGLAHHESRQPSQQACLLEKGLPAGWGMDGGVWLVGALMLSGPSSVK